MDMPNANDKDAFYFSHDCNARNDPKILALRSVYGAEGYGVYFMLIEILREQPTYKLSANKYIWNTLAMQMQSTADRIEKIVSDCCTEFEDKGSFLLTNDGKYLYSESLIRRMERADEVSEKRSQAASKRWQNKACKDSEDSDECKSNANAEQMQSNEDALQCNKTRPDQNIPDQNIPEKKRVKKNTSNVFIEFANGNEKLIEALNGFEEMRNRIKEPMTDYAKRLLLKKLEQLSKQTDIQIAILNESTTNNWKSVYALKGDKQKQKSSNPALDRLKEMGVAGNESG
jgi:hypothetical protein